MKKTWINRAAMVMVGGTLFGAVATVLPSGTTGTSTTAHAAMTISQDTFTSDMAALQSAVAGAGHGVQADIGASNYANMKEDPTDAYEGYGTTFSSAIYTVGSGAYMDYFYDENNDYTYTISSDFSKDWNALTALYNHFKGRLSTQEQAQLASMSAAVTSEKDPRTKLDNVRDFGRELSDAVDAWSDGATVAKPVYTSTTTTKPATTTQTTTKTTTKKATKKSYINKLSVKKTHSKKYVKVTGSAKLYKSANYAHIKTYKGYRYAKLSKKHNFSKTIYAPKAKTVKVTVGHYAHGHFTAVTSAKSVHVK